MVLCLLWCNISLTDEKPGRFFEDQPDVNDDYQIHFIYTLAADSKDREWDINGKIEKITDKMNKLYEKKLKATKSRRYPSIFLLAKQNIILYKILKIDLKKYRQPDYACRYLALTIGHQAVAGNR